MAGAKVDFKRELRELYSAKRDVTFVAVPELQFAMVDGRGDPNEAPEYAEAVQALFSVSYTARFALKRAPDGLDYGVMPLEGLWWAQDMSAFTTGDKSSWDWTMMIMQPEQVTHGSLRGRLRSRHARRSRCRPSSGCGSSPSARGVRHSCSTSGLTQPRARRSSGCTSSSPTHGCEPVGKHHEIYLNDPSRTVAREAQDDHPPARSAELRRAWNSGA